MAPRTKTRRSKSIQPKYAKRRTLVKRRTKRRTTRRKSYVGHLLSGIKKRTKSLVAKVRKNPKMAAALGVGVGAGLMYGGYHYKRSRPSKQQLQLSSPQQTKPLQQPKPQPKPQPQPLQKPKKQKTQRAQVLLHIRSNYWNEEDAVDYITRAMWSHYQHTYFGRKLSKAEKSEADATKYAVNETIRTMDSLSPPTYYLMIKTLRGRITEQGISKKNLNYTIFEQIRNHVGVTGQLKLIVNYIFNLPSNSALLQ
jgi:hypothetical protein